MLGASLKVYRDENPQNNPLLLGDVITRGEIMSCILRWSVGGGGGRGCINIKTIFFFILISILEDLKKSALTNQMITWST